MTQVHIRQVPLVTSTNAQKIAGSWVRYITNKAIKCFRIFIYLQFPTSYYGNVRAKSRAELCNYFRQLAQPNPPRKFTARQTVKLISFFIYRYDYFCSSILG